MKVITRVAGFITTPIVLLNLILLVQFGLFTATTLHPYTIKTPGRSYLYLRGHLIYSSLIRQAKDGAWKFTIPHTTRPTPAVYGHLFFVFLGKIAAIFNIDPPIMYMASRVAAAVILFYCTYWLITLILPKAVHSLALLLTLALEPGPLLTSLSGKPPTWIPAIFSYYPQVVAYRHFGLPHHTMGEAVGLLFLGTFILCVRQPNARRFVILFFLGIIGANILPPYFAILGMTVLGPWLIYSLFTGNWKRLVIPLAISAVTVGSVALFMSHEFAKGYPWRDFNFDEKRWVTNSDALVNYGSSLLLYIPFIALLWGGIIKYWRHWEREIRLLVFLTSAWIILPIPLVLISAQHWFPLANFRLMDGYDYVPAGILATLGLTYFTKSFKSKQFASFLKGFLIMGVVVASGFLTYVYTTQTLNEQHDIWTNIYPSNDAWKAFRFLDTLPRGSGIMVMNHFGEILPEFADVRSFIGSTPGFPDWQERYYIAINFFSGKMNESDALATLKRENISYVYYGADEETQFNLTGTLYPDILTPVFVTPNVTVFKVKYQ